VKELSGKVTVVTAAWMHNDVSTTSPDHPAGAEEAHWLGKTAAGPRHKAGTEISQAAERLRPAGIFAGSLHFELDCPGAVAAGVVSVLVYLIGADRWTPALVAEILVAGPPLLWPQDRPARRRATDPSPRSTPSIGKPPVAASAEIIWLDCFP
jgi:hypothetical protein